MAHAAHWSRAATQLAAGARYWEYAGRMDHAQLTRSDRTAPPTAPVEVSRTKRVSACLNTSHCALEAGLGKTNQRRVYFLFLFWMDGWMVFIRDDNSPWFLFFFGVACLYVECLKAKCSWRLVLCRPGPPLGSKVVQFLGNLAKNRNGTERKERKS